MYRSTRAEISLSALIDNFNLLRGLVSKNQFFLPIVKANAYGHGDVVVASTLRDKCGAEFFGVGTIDEAISLRNGNILEPLFLLGPVYDVDAIEALIKYSITPIVSDWRQLYKLSEVKEQKWNIHLKFDTGMRRLGFTEEDIYQICEFLNQNQQFSVSGVCSHLYRGEDFSSTEGSSQIQFNEFNNIRKKLSEKIKTITYWHLLNSDGLLSSKKRSQTVDLGARPGIALYGYSSLSNQSVSLNLNQNVNHANQCVNQLKPIMKLITSISHVTKVRKGQSVSYGATWVAKKDSLIATLPIGYADGYRRVLSSKGQVFLLGQVAPVVGTICMDYMMIDVSDIKRKDELGIGTEVELFGNQISLIDLANTAGTITYELLTGLSPRVNRYYK